MPKSTLPSNLQQTVQQFKVSNLFHHQVSQFCPSNLPLFLYLFANPFLILPLLYHWPTLHLPVFQPLLAQELSARKFLPAGKAIVQLSTLLRQNVYYYYYYFYQISYKYRLYLARSAVIQFFMIDNFYSSLRVSAFQFSLLFLSWFIFPLLLLCT